METKETVLRGHKFHINAIWIVIIGVILIIGAGSIMLYFKVYLSWGLESRTPADWIREPLIPKILCEWCFSPEKGMEFKNLGKFKITAYTDRECETDDTPQITASGRIPYRGSGAISPDFFMKSVFSGELIWIELINTYLVIEDTMAADKTRWIDVFYPVEKLEQAKAFGMKESNVYIIRHRKRKTRRPSMVQQTKSVQVKLKLLDYYVGKVDGVLGRNTVEALKEFQRENRLKVTGKVDKKTLKKLEKLCKY